jgi:hypothetical protein
MTTARLVDAMRAREEGPWSLLAAAAGAPRAVELVARALRGDALAEGAHGPASAPSDVREHVEALAAWSRTELVHVARTWMPPRLIGTDPWWAAAWETALRHLASASAIRRDEAAGQALRLETEMVFGLPTGSASWRRLAASGRTRIPSYGALRSESRRPLLETTITRQDLEQSPRLFLRLLRGRAWLLDGRARQVIGQWLDALPGGDAFEDALVFETAAELGLPGRDGAIERMAGALADVRDPRRLAAVAYTMLGRWLVP